MTIIIQTWRLERKGGTRRLSPDGTPPDLFEEVLILRKYGGWNESDRGGPLPEAVACDRLEPLAFEARRLTALPESLIQALWQAIDEHQVGRSSWALHPLHDLEGSRVNLSDTAGME
jgi:hypothetical protein